MGLLALCLVLCCALNVSTDKEKTRTDIYPSTLDIACKQLSSSRCSAHSKWTSRCPREMKAKGSARRSKSFRIRAHRERKTWDEALKVCQSEGGTLAMPKTKEKQTVLKRRTRYTDGRIWIGLKDTDGNNSYQWIDGEVLTYTHWSDGEPNCVNETCVSYVKSLLWYESGWFDDACDQERVFICQY